MPIFQASSIFPEVYLLSPQRFEDERGFFMESYRASWLSEIANGAEIVQENRSFSKQGVLRGLHYQLEQPQGKLIQVLSGVIFDVLVDVRKNSATFGQWQGFTLDAKDYQQLWIPPGFAHGFYALTDADMLYRCSNYYHAASERSLKWDDTDLAIAWPLKSVPIVSVKDQQATPFNQADCFQ